jgi:hypothetical protein
MTFKVFLHHHRFVKFKNKTAAATAIDMFNNFKLGNSKGLLVRYREPNRNELSSGDGLRTNNVIGSAPPDENEDWESVKEPPLIATNGVGGPSNTSKPDPLAHINRSNFNLSRPFARMLLNQITPNSGDSKENKPSATVSGKVSTDKPVIQQDVKPKGEYVLDYFK